MRALHILTPASNQTPASLIEDRPIAAGDLIADLRGFPCSVYEIQSGRNFLNITSRLLSTQDYWAVAREWFVQFTEKTGLQDELVIDGYGFWWTINGQRFVPGISETGNLFAWIDLLAAVHEKSHPDSIIIYGNNHSISYLVGEIYSGVGVRLETLESTSKEHSESRNIGLIITRLFLSLIYLAYSLVRRPSVLLFSSTNLLRKTTIVGKQKLRDVYLSDVFEALRARGWRVTFVEKLGRNASWAKLFARGFFFPNDIVFILSMPLLHRFGLYRGITRNWHTKWQRVRPTIVPHIHYRNYDIAPLILPLIAEEFTRHAPDLQVMVGQWRRILRIWRPKLLYIINSYGRSAMTAIIAAKSLNIATIEQQHGVINRDHIPYLIPRELKIKSEFPLCDYMVVWGEYTKRLMVGSDVFQSDQIAVCGFPRVNHLLRNLPPRSITLAKLDIPASAEVILYTSNKIAQGFLHEILDGIQSRTNTIEVHWIIKLHPAEKTHEAWQQAINQRQLHTVKVIKDELDFYSLLAACDIHVSFTSTTLIEAAILGKLNFGLDVAQIPDPVGYKDAKAFLPVTPSRLGAKVYEILHDSEKRKRLLNEQKAFARDWCVHDGKAVDRIVSFIENKIAMDSQCHSRTQEIR